MRMRLTLTFTALLFLITAATVMAAPSLKQVGEFVIPEANQGVGVDDRYFYAVDKPQSDNL
jgi:hypothetical protein